RRRASAEGARVLRVRRRRRGDGRTPEHPGAAGSAAGPSPGGVGRVPGGARVAATRPPRRRTGSLDSLEPRRAAPGGGAVPGRRGGRPPTGGGGAREDDGVVALRQSQALFDVSFDRGRDDAALQRVGKSLCDGAAVGVQLLLPQLPDRAGETLIVLARLQLSRVHLLFQRVQLLDEAFQRNRCHRITPWVL